MQDKLIIFLSLILLLNLQGYGDQYIHVFCITLVTILVMLELNISSLFQMSINLYRCLLKPTVMIIIIINDVKLLGISKRYCVV